MKRYANKPNPDTNHPSPFRKSKYVIVSGVDEPHPEVVDLVEALVSMMGLERLPEEDSYYLGAGGTITYTYGFSASNLADTDAISLPSSDFEALKFLLPGYTYPPSWHGLIPEDEMPMPVNIELAFAQQLPNQEDLPAANAWLNEWLQSP